MMYCSSLFNLIGLDFESFDLILGMWWWVLLWEHWVLSTLGVVMSTLVGALRLQVAGSPCIEDKWYAGVQAIIRRQRYANFLKIAWHGLAWYLVHFLWTLMEERQLTKITCGPFGEEPGCQNISLKDPRVSPKSQSPNKTALRLLQIRTSQTRWPS